MPTAMPPMPNKDDSDGTWKYLEVGVEKIMTELQEGMDLKTYMGLYTAIHNFCTAQKAVSSGGFHAHNRGGAHLLGEDLYHHLIKYLENHLHSVQAKSTSHVDEALLRFYIKEWKRYTTAATYNNHLFRYLNRHWVKREMDEGKKNVYDIYTLHLVRWRDDMFMHTNQNVMNAVLRLVEKQRNGETIESSQIKSVVDSFVSLGLDESDSTKPTLDIYKQYFEEPFLVATGKYYSKESKEFLAENSVVEYMKKAETRLDEERERVDLYLLSEILGPLSRTCEEALIKNHCGILREEFQSLLDHDRVDDLGRMYKLLARLGGDGLDPLRSRFETHVRKCGLAAVERIAVDGDDLDPKVYVQALLEVHTKYQDLVNTAFAGESEFVRSLDNACREFVNRNKVCKTGSNRSPELLAKYADRLLKKSDKTMAEEDDMDKSQTEIMTIFKYIEDKDVFQTFYSRNLAKRLVNTTSASDDAETSMISKLKEACGFEYTNKLQRMFQDIQTSKDTNTAYKDFLSNTYGDAEAKTFVDASYYILGTGFWPLQPPSTHFIPPEVINKTIERFTTFYNNKHQGRKLNWLWQLSKGEIRANYTKSAQKIPHTFQVSTYQMAILLCWNAGSDVLTYAEIEAATKLNKETLDPCLGVFLKARVLTASDDKYLPATTFTLNTGFRSKKLKVNLNIGIKSEKKQEEVETHKTIEEDRKMLMQSAIVRIMKSRKRMKHTLLVNETIQQIKGRFTPKVGDIKKCIDMLIEKEYLERLEGDELGYLA